MTNIRKLKDTNVLKATFFVVVVNVWLYSVEMRPCSDDSDDICDQKWRLKIPEIS